MPLQQVSPEQAAWLISQGKNPDDYSFDPTRVPVTPEAQIGIPSTIGRTLQARAGSLVGSSAAIPGMWAGVQAGALLGLPEAGIGAIPGAIIGGTIGALGGSYLGQKAQGTILGDERQQALELAAQQAAEQHPIVSAATDIGASALASGGLPSPTTAVKGLVGIGRGLIGQGLNNEAKQVLLQAALNPAIATGTSLAQGQGVPSIGELGQQALGGALFAKSWVPHGRIPISPVEEPTPDITQNETSNPIAPEQPKQLVGPRRFYGSNSGIEDISAREPASDIIDVEATSPATRQLPLNAGPNAGKDVGLTFTHDVLQELIDKGATKPISVQRIFPKLNLTTAEAEEALRQADLLAELHTNNNLPEAPIVQFTKTANNIKANLPSEQPGFTRLWRGNRKDEEGKNPSFTNSLEGIALPFQKGYGGNLSYIDVPTTEVLKYLNDAGAAQGSEFILPKEILHNTKIVPKELYATGIREDKGQSDEVGTQGEGSQENSGNDVVEETPRSQDVAIPPVTSKEALGGKEEELTQEEANKQLEESGDVKSSALSDYNRYQELKAQLRGKSLDESLPIQQEIEALKNKYGGKPPPEFPEDRVLSSNSLQYHVINGRATTGSVLRSLATTPDHPFQELAKHLLDTSDTQSLLTPWRLDNTLDKSNARRSHYSIANDQVNISHSSLRNARVVMEEAIHSLTSKKIPSFGGQGAEHYNRLNAYVNRKGGNETVKDLIRSYFETVKHLGKGEELFADKYDAEGNVIEQGAAGSGDEAIETIQGLGHTTKYALGDIHEFVAQALKDHSFQRVLESIPTDDNRSVWQHIVDAVKNLLGLKGKSGSMLERVLRSSGELVHQERPSGLDKLNTEYPEQAIEEPPKEINSPPKEKELIPPPTKKPLVSRILSKLQATNDAVRAKSPLLGNALDRFAEVKSQLVADKTTAVHDLSKYNRKLVDKVMAKHREAYRTETEPSLTAKEKPISDIISNYYSHIADERRAAGIRINGREAGKNKWYVPDQLNIDAIKTFTEDSQSARASYLKKLWAEHVNEESNGKIPKSEALENINNYIAALGGNKGNYNSAKFGAIRKAAGYGLPEGMRETDAIASLDKYGERAATDIAMYKELESKPDVQEALKLRNPITGEIPTSSGEAPDLSQDKDVRNAMKWVTNDFNHNNHPALAASIRVANNGILGAGTGLRDIAQVPVNLIPYLTHISDIAPILKGISNVRSNARAALESGATKPQIDRIRFNQLTSDSTDNFTSAAQKLGDMLRKYQGREALENFSRDITFSIGKELTKTRVLEAIGGDKKAIKWLSRFGLLVDKDITKLSGGELEDAVNQTAKNFVDANQGTYDARGLPTGIIDSQLAPFLSLQKWSVEKANTIYKDVYKPFVSGENRIPLLTYTLGAVMTGAGIQELNKLLNNRKSQDPEVNEAIESNSPHAIASELANLMSLSSYGGIVGDSLKVLSDISNRKAPRNPFAFPLGSAAMDLGTRTAEVVDAINSGEEPVSVLGQYATDLLTHNIQSARMLYNHTANSDKIEDSDKFRDLRVFNELEGNRNKDFTPSNPYLNIDEKAFKKAKSPEEAIAMLPSLISGIIAESDGDPFKLQEKLRGLKTNSYQTLPNMQNAPLAFSRYITFLQKTQGPEEAQNRLIDYLTQTQVNQIKSSIIP